MEVILGKENKTTFPWVSSYKYKKSLGHKSGPLLPDMPFHMEVPYQEREVIKVKACFRVTSHDGTVTHFLPRTSHCIAKNEGYSVLLF